MVRVQNQATLDASPVAQAVLAFMESRDEWTGLATKLHEELKDTAEDLGIDVLRDKAWPKSPLWLTRRIREVMPLLTTMGINVVIPQSRKKGTKVSLTKGAPDSGPEGGSKSGSGGSKNGATATATATEDPAQVSQLNPQAPNGGSSGSKFGCSYIPKPEDKEEAKTGHSPVDNPEKGAEDTLFEGLPKNTASTATGPDNTTRTCPHGGGKNTDEEWEEF